MLGRVPTSASSFVADSAMAPVGWSTRQRAAMIPGDEEAPAAIQALNPQYSMVETAPPSVAPRP